MTTTETRLDEKALPCPFCGRDARVDPHHAAGPAKWMVSCSSEYTDECNATAQASGPTRKKAIANWNRRAALPRVDAAPTSEAVERTCVAPPPTEKDITNLRHWYEVTCGREGTTRVDHDSMFRILGAIDPALYRSPAQAVPPQVTGEEGAFFDAAFAALMRSPMKSTVSVHQWRECMTDLFAALTKGGEGHA